MPKATLQSPSTGLTPPSSPQTQAHVVMFRQGLCLKEDACLTLDGPHAVLPSVC